MNALIVYYSNAKPLGRQLRQLGGKQIVPAKSYFVVEEQGPLYEGEVERAKRWAETILGRHERFSERSPSRRS